MSDPSEILKRRLQAVVDGEQKARGLHFFCQIGATYHAFGMLTLQVSGNGRMLAGWRSEDDERDLYSVQLTESDWVAFYKMLLSHPFWECTPQRRKRRDDRDLNIHVRLSDQQAGTWGGIQFWAEDMKEFPVLDKLMYRIGRIVEAISQGDLPSPDWDEVSSTEE